MHLGGWGRKGFHAQKLLKNNQRDICKFFSGQSPKLLLKGSGPKKQKLKTQLRCHDMCKTVCVCWLLSHVQLFLTAWTVAHQAPLSMGFSRQEYWRGFPFPSPEDLPKPGIEARSPALQADSLPSELSEKSLKHCISCKLDYFSPGPVPREEMHLFKIMANVLRSKCKANT